MSIKSIRRRRGPSGATTCCKPGTRDIVRANIDKLPEIYRDILILRDIEELDTEETARLLNVNNSVVKTRLHRAGQGSARCSTRISETRHELP